MSDRPSRRPSRTARRAACLSAAATLALAAVLLLGVRAVDAVSTERFVLDDAGALGAGELTRTAAHSDGRVTVGVELRRVGLPDDVPLIYSAAQSGDAVFLGTGNDGRVYRLAGETVALYAETGQAVVTSLAIGVGGELFAGTLPEGRVFRIAAGGQVTELARPDGVEHVWDLVFDPQRRRLFAATGPEGRVYAIDPQGRAEIYWDSTAAHVMSLALGADGAVYAGTSDDAIVARLTGPGRAEIVYDFPGNEITSIDYRAGELAVAANEFADPPAVTSAHSRPRAASTARAPRPRPGKGRIWRVSADGRAEQVYAQETGHITDVELGAEGVIHAGTGADGRVIRVNPDRSSAVWIDVDERQVMRVSMLGAAPFFVTADGAAVYRIVDTTPTDAVWESKVLDARFRARWGQLDWRADGELTFQTRSGNTENVDESWSDWSSPTTRPGPVRSGQGRFLQVRARFDRDPRAVLRSLTVYFLPQNQRARVTDVRVEGENAAATKRMRAERQDTVPDPSSLLKLAWTVENPDGDRLRYRVRVRREDQTVWRDLLPSDQVLTNDEYRWQTESISDGWYVVQVEASDELDNPRRLRLTDSRESEPIRVDNHAPRVENLRVAGGQLSGRAIDSLGPIARIELAIDGDEWEPVFPVDDLFDTAEERFSVDVSALPAGPHVISVRATDAGGNRASAELEATVR